MQELVIMRRCRVFRNQIKDHVVPITEQINKQHAERINVDRLKFMTKTLLLNLVLLNLRLAHKKSLKMLKNVP